MHEKSMKTSTQEYHMKKKKEHENSCILHSNEIMCATGYNYTQIQSGLSVDLSQKFTINCLFCFHEDSNSKYIITSGVLIELLNFRLKIGDWLTESIYTNSSCSHFF